MGLDVSRMQRLSFGAVRRGLDSAMMALAILGDQSVSCDSGRIEGRGRVDAVNSSRPVHPHLGVVNDCENVEALVDVCEHACTGRHRISVRFDRPPVRRVRIISM
jgi:hypothetical protein